MGICLSVLQADVCNNLASVVAYLFSAEECIGYQRFKQLHVLSSEYRYPSVGAGAQSVSQLKRPSGAVVSCFFCHSFHSPDAHCFRVTVQPAYNTHTVVM